jgi:hypothetical protein
LLSTGATIAYMKLSVSVPDDLWDEVRSIAADSNSSSAVVQEGLRRWVTQARGGPGYATSAPEDVLGDRQEAHERLAREARAEFEHGYAQGVQCARRLPWWAIENLADHHGFRVREWARAWATAAVELDMAKPSPSLRKADKAETIDAWLRSPRRRPFDWTGVDADVQATDAVPRPHVVVRALIPALGVFVPPYGDELEFCPSMTYLRGFTQAMRDIWSSVAEGSDLD